MIPHSYKSYLSLPYWLEVKRMVRLRDRFTCQDCGKRKLVEVHHLTYAHRGHEKEHLEDLICLCPACHDKRHGRNQKNKIQMAKERVYRVTFTDGSKCTVKLKNKRGKTINTAGAMEYAEFVHNKKAVEIELW